MISERKELWRTGVLRLVWRQTLMSKDEMKLGRSHLRSRILGVSEKLERTGGMYSTRKFD